MIGINNNINEIFLIINMDRNLKYQNQLIVWIIIPVNLVKNKMLVKNKKMLEKDQWVQNIFLMSILRKFKLASKLLRQLKII